MKAYLDDAAKLKMSRFYLIKPTSNHWISPNDEAWHALYYHGTIDDEGWITCSDMRMQLAIVNWLGVIEHLTPTLLVKLLLEKESK